MSPHRSPRVAKRDVSSLTAFTLVPPARLLGARCGFLNEVPSALLPPARVPSASGSTCLLLTSVHPLLLNTHHVSTLKLKKLHRYSLSFPDRLECHLALPDHHLIMLLILPGLIFYLQPPYKNSSAAQPLFYRQEHLITFYFLSPKKPQQNLYFIATNASTQPLFYQ